ncbi:MAG: PEP-CTERM sorting domain-containing protein, partial [Gemmatimonadota bacterium]|nr:PEP-CTERM sorting domain-containing protein [Gemmatimonadota bacterium]
NLMSDGTAMQGITTVGGNAASQGKLTDAFAELNADPNAVNASEWMVITDASGSTQEFITRNVVPEPETIILLVSGLMAIGAVAYFRGVSA